MKKVLILVYYWPPAGGGGVQRWVKMSAYLKKMGWEPLIYTAEDADYPIIDESLIKEIDPEITVIRRPIFEPRKVYQNLLGGKKQESKKKSSADEIFYLDPKQRSWKQNLSIWIRGNLFIPDARSFWIGPSFRFLKQYLKKHPVDAIITSGPPHSMHVIGLKLKRALGVNWVADFRDPWTQIEYYDRLMLTGWADRKHKRLEKAVFQEADAIANVADYWNIRANEEGAQQALTITNGYDTRDFQHEPPALSEKFLLLHAGTLANDRNPHTLWEVLEEMASEIPSFREDLRIEVIGKTDPIVLRKAEEAGLSENLISGGYVDHPTAIRKMQAAQVLLLLINDVAFNALGRMTGKIFEYLAAKRPILLIGPVKGDAANVVRETQSGAVADFRDKSTLKSILQEYYRAYQAGNLQVNSQGIEQFSRESTAGKYAELLTSISQT
ncbi:MAG: glycosyl transferase family 1 [Bacteroidota bacterium]